MTGLHHREETKLKIKESVLKSITPETLNKISKANKGRVSPTKGLSWEQQMGKEKSEERKNRSKVLLERNNPMYDLDVRQKVADANTGKKLSINTIKKIRLSVLKDLENKNGILYPNYNFNGCKYFNELMEQTGTYIQHAENDGEYHIKELGYWVDGYDKENNIVYEYDEKEHFVNGKLKEKDVRRQKEIEDFLSCKFIRIKEKCYGTNTVTRDTNSKR